MSTPESRQSWQRKVSSDMKAFWDWDEELRKDARKKLAGVKGKPEVLEQLAAKEAVENYTDA